MTSTNSFQKLKRVVVKEELIALTGDFIKAVILNQFIYWSERVQDFDKFILEEKNRASQEGVEISMEQTKGWIYKKAEELSEETMLSMAPSTILRHVKVLVENGWLDERQNPEYRWDRTRQYRVNLVKIHNDLLKLGYMLQDYRIEVPFFKIENGTSILKNGEPTKVEDTISEIENATSTVKTRNCKMKNGECKIENQSVQNESLNPPKSKSNTRDYLQRYNTYINHINQRNDDGEKQKVSEATQEVALTNKCSIAVTNNDEQLYDDYEEVVMYYYKKIVEDEKILPYVHKWVTIYGKELVIYMIDRLAEQEKVTSVVRWMEVALESPNQYPPKITYSKHKDDSSGICSDFTLEDINLKEYIKRPISFSDN